MSVIKKPYEISIWEDIIVYVGKDVNNQYIESTDLSQLSSVDYQYYTEQRLAIISSNTMTSPARAINPVYKKNINGIETLTFDMYYQYEEVESGEIIRNPLINLVLDERKVKLWYENDWHDFIVKKDDEKGRDYKYSFTCTGLAANELGKTGFNIELDTELENNMGTVQELAAAVLEGSDWQLSDEQEVIQQTNEEALYKLTTSEVVSATIRGTDTIISVPNNSIIYVYYTTFATQESNYFQFIYTTNTYAIPDLMEDGITINCNNTTTYDLFLENVTWENNLPDFAEGSAIQVAQYRGNRYVRKQLTAYDPTLQQTVSEYTRDGTTYYGYTTTKYIDSTTVQNYIYNSVNFAGTSYWGIYGNSNSKSISAQVFPSVSSNNTSVERAGYLVVNFGNSTATKLVNEGIIQNYSRIDKFEKGDKFRFRLYAGTVSEDTFTAFTTSTLPINCKVKKYETIDVDSANDIIYFNSADSSTVISTDSSGYICVDMVCLESATWRELKENVGIFFSLNNASETNYYIKDIQFYRYLIGKNGCVVAPDDPIENLPDVRIETVYHFYDPSINIGKFSEEDYVFSESDPSLYTPLYGSGENEFEKTRSITAKESNRFNLLQELSETFECWVKFKVEHESNGTIKVEDFDYYDIVSNSDPEQLSNYYIYDWLNKQYIQPTEYDENAQYYTKVTRKRQVKKVSFYKEILIDNYAGFKYGINLNANNRTLDSEQIVTKIIVKNNSCDQAENGFCSIARAQDNPIKENFVYNFDYYTSQGLINQSTLNNDLYLEVNGSIGLYPRLSRLNKERNALIDSSAPLANSINDLTSKYQVATLMYNEAEKDLQRMKDPQSGTIYLYTHYVYEDFYNQYGRIGTSEVVNVNVPSYPNEIYYISVEGLSNITTNDNSNLTFYQLTTDTSPQPGTTYYYMSSGKFVQLYATSFRTTTHYYIKLNNASYAAETYFQTSGTTSTLTFTGSGSPEVYVYNAARRRMQLGAEDYIDDNFTISTLEKITTQEANKAQAQAEMEEYGTDLENTQAQYDAIESQLKEIVNATDEVEKEFNVKYARYIQEGSWMDDNYMDDDLYYLDSLGVLYQSAYPKVSYNFTVLDLSQLDGYEAYKFDIGHKTFVEDKEFFGYKIVDGLKTPVREQVVVTEANINLDEPDKNSLKVQNYKSHFEDLFQRITAATQSLEYHSGEYGRAAGAITPEGEVSPTVMQKSLATSSYIIQNSKDQSVTWDETGLQAVNLSDPAQIVRLASSGIIISTDGGNSWGTAITGYGINTNYLTAGQIDADNINIMSGSFPTFKWDALGLRAYGFNLSGNTITSYDPSRYVTYDRFGIYGVNGLTDVQFNNIGEIKDSKNVAFGLTWDGLFIRSTHRDGYVSISSTDDIILVEEQESDGTITNVIRGKFGLIKEGGSDQNTPNDIYGLVLYDVSGNPTLTTQSNGTLQLLDSIKIGNDDVSNEPRIYIGKGEIVSAAGVTPEVYKVMRVSNNGADQFVVYSDGSIKANSGTIGNMNISSLPATIGVRISPAVGTFKIDGGVATPSSITFTCNTSLEGITGYKWKHNTTTSIDYTNPNGTGSSYTYTYNAADFTSGGIMYLGVQVTCSSGTYTDRITISTVSDGDAEVYTYEIESSLGDVINTSSLGSGVTTTTITGHIYRTAGTVTTEVTSSFTFEWHKKIGNVDSIISGESTNSFNLSLDDWNNVQVWFVATEQS